MEISELLAEKDIALDVRAKDKLSALSQIAARLANRTGLDKQSIREGFLAHENANSTAVGSGVAIPHALMDHLPHPTGLLMRLLQPVEFGATDNIPVDLLFAILWPQSSAVDFLPMLARVSRFLRTDVVRDMLRQARSPADVFGVIWFKQKELDEYQ